jgi:hypothetical protein
MSYGIGRIHWVSVGVLVGACGGAPTDETAGGEATPTTATTQADTIVCMSRGEGSGFGTGALAVPNGPFTLEFSANVDGRDQDALFGLAQGPVDHYTDMAAILRFNPAGMVDARNGGAYAADSAYPYTPHSTRQFRLEVDPAAHTYSAKAVAPSGVVTIGENFAFRSEQAGTSSLDHFGLIAVEGYIGVCDMVFEEACHQGLAGGGFFSHTVPAQSNAFTAAFTATPHADNMDGVFGFAGLAAKKFTDLPISVRFNPDGFIDARNGAGYAATEAIPYSAGTSYTFKFFVDPLTHRYSAFVNDQLFAKNFAFRSEQANASYFHYGVAVAVAGSFDVCDFTTAAPERLVYMHDLDRYPQYSIHTLVPLDDQGLLAVTSASTQELDFKGDVVRTVPWGGAMGGIDFAQNRYLAGNFSGSYDGGSGSVTSAGGTDIYVSKYDAAWNPIYTRAFGAPEDDAMVRFAVNGNGEAAVRSWNTLYRLDGDGNLLWTREVSPFTGLLALDDQGNAYVHRREIGSSDFFIHKFDAQNQELWVRSGKAPEGYSTIEELKATSDGKLVLSGTLNGQLKFGSALLESWPEGTFVFELDAAGNYLWGHTQPGINGWTGLGVDGQGRITLCSNELDPSRMFLTQYAADGSSNQRLSSRDLMNGFEGFIGHCAVNRRGDAFVTGTGALYTGFVSFLLKQNAPF